MTSRPLTLQQFHAAATELCEKGRADWNRMDGFARATDPGPELSEATLEEACARIVEVQRGCGFAYRCWRLYSAPDALFRASLGVDHDQRERVFRQLFDSLQRPQPRMRKEFAQLFDGDTLIGQLMIERPFDARDWLPYVERIHPDDMKLGPLPGDGVGLVCGGTMRVQRFNLHKGRYRLEGSYEPA